jgi:hypothetical protein
MLAKSIWIVGLAIEMAILLRALWTRLYLRFPIFYGYLFSVFASSVSLWVLYDRSYYRYHQWYWYWQGIMILLGYGVVVEIMHKALEDYRGADRLALFLAGVMFVLFFGAIAFSLVTHTHPLAIADWRSHADAIERDLRIVQASFLFLTVAVALYFRIELGRNLKGLVLGFGAFVGVSVIATAFSYYFGEKFAPIFKELQPVAYLFSLCVWLVALWESVTVTNKPPKPPADEDYEKIAGETRKKLREVRSRLSMAENR